ncbi:amidase [Cerasicoccus arenae]|uniref:Amidase n=2 Tax=Cerasicoccus arenae TaxID=424488 RepID=A0A8J3DAL9_9BACT|nr:amidase [Cerasicoccus arenae]
MPERDALTEAFARGALIGGPLGGVPYVLKDLFDVVGAPTTAGSGFLTEVRPTPQMNAKVAEVLAAQGAVLSGKVSMVEFAYGMSGENLWFGDVPHPRIPTALAGGSSSGSAFAVGRGLTPFSIGTDTAGSMRVPAAYCGLYAWRDIPGPLSQEGCFPLASSFDTTGWFTQTAEELLVLNDLFLGQGPAADCVRILDLTDLSAGLTPELREAGNAWLARKEATANAEALALAQRHFADAARAYNVLGSREAYVTHAPWLDEYRARYDPIVWGRIDRGRRWSKADITFATAKQAEVKEAWSLLLADYDAIALPITPIPSPGKAVMTEDYRSELLSLTAPASLGHCPALTIPLCLSDGTSGGLQLVMANDTRQAVAKTLLATD